MTTFATLKVNIARDLRDPGMQTFTTETIGDLANEALAEVGRIAPRRFQVDIVPIANTMSYAILQDDFPAELVPEIEIFRVELWDGTTTPATPIGLVAPAAEGYVNFSQVGWSFWGGNLEIPRWITTYVAGNESSYQLRVWGYAPYPRMDQAEDIVPCSPELEWALRARAKVGALERLVFERDLFTQWQTRSNNSDVSPASLMNSLNLAQEDWRRRSRAIAILREAP